MFTRGGKRARSREEALQEAYLSGRKESEEGVVASCCNPLTLHPEQSGGRGSNPTSTFELLHDKESRTRLTLSYFCDRSARSRKLQLHLHFHLQRESGIKEKRKERKRMKGGQMK